MTYKTVAVFGASGFIGNALAESLETAGFNIVRPTSPSGGRLDIAGSVDDLIRAIDGVDVVVNAAGRAHLHSPDPGAFWPSNAVGALNIALAAKRSGSVRRLVHVSSAAVGRGGMQPMVADYEPVSAYGASKAAGELAVSAVFDCVENKELVVVRPAGVGGIESPGSWGTIRRRAKAEAVIPVPSNDVRFDVVEIEAVVQHLHSAAIGDIVPGVYNLAGSAPLTLKEYANSVSMQYETNPRIVPIPDFALRFAGAGAALARRLFWPVGRIEQLAETMTKQRPLIDQAVLAQDIPISQHKSGNP